MSDSFWPYGLRPTRLLCPWDSPGKNMGVGCHFLLQEVFLTQGLNLGLLHCRQILYPLSHHGSLCTWLLEKTKVLTIQTFVSKVISLLFNTLSRFVIAFLLRSKCLLISWLQSLSTVILEPKKIKSVMVSTFSLSICHEVKGPDAMIVSFLNVDF